MVALRLSLVGLLLATFQVSPSSAQEPKKRKLLLVSQSPDGHPKATHEYVPGMKIMQRCLRERADLETTLVVADGPWLEGADLLKSTDAALFFVAEGAKWVQAEPRRFEALQQLAARGGGLGAIHWAIGSKAAEPVEQFQKLFGGCHGGPDRKYRDLTTEVSPVGPTHPATRGLERFALRDEFYFRVKFLPGATNLRPLLTARIDGHDEPVAWAWERPDGGRSFGFTGLHFHENWRRVEYQRFVVQATLWSLRLPTGEQPVAPLTDDDFRLP